MNTLKNWIPFRFRRQQQAGKEGSAPPAHAAAGQSVVPSAGRLLAGWRDDMDRMFERLLHQPLAAFEGADRWFGDFSAAAFEPKLDVTDDAKFLKVALEMPGVELKDLQIEVHDGMLSIGGEKRAETTSGDEGCYRTERSYGWFRRTVPLPAEVDASKAEARLDKGVLTVQLPKTQAAQQQPVRVAVKG